MFGGRQKRSDLRALIALCCCLAGNSQAETFSAKVIAVIDGDTVLVLREGGGKDAGYPPASPMRGRQRIKVRLANIDAPEKDQAFGKQSRESLREMVDKKQVQIASQAVDQYGRTIGLISLEGLNISQEQVKRGMAWDYSHYHSDKTYVALQNDARQTRRGLWSQNNPLAPWQWRKLHPSVKHIAQPRQHGASGHAVPVMLYDLECGKKHRCAQMVSCEEARFYFASCDEKMLDGNHDGEPCERLCGGKQ